MRGFVLRFPAIRRRKKYGEKSSNVRGFFSRYGVVLLYIFSFGIGMVFGVVKAGNASGELLKSMDFLFTTNLSARLTHPMYMTFASSFASNFLFLFLTFLSGLTAWGFILIFGIPMFKGFGTGLSAGFLVINFGFRGVGFYILVMLLGLFVFSFALIVECTQAHVLSRRIIKLLIFPKEIKEPVMVYVRDFLIRSLYVLIMGAIASCVDMLLWSFFAKVFF